jgi:hypothetical protein
MILHGGYIPIYIHTHNIGSNLELNNIMIFLIYKK